MGKGSSTIQVTEEDLKKLVDEKQLKTDSSMKQAITELCDTEKYGDELTKAQAEHVFKYLSTDAKFKDHFSKRTFDRG